MQHISEIVNNLPAKGSSNEKPLTPKLENSFLCPECGGTGYFRQDAEPGTPQFGKLIRCEHPSHSEERQARIAGVSGLDKADLARRLADIEPVHFTRKIKVFEPGQNTDTEREEVISNKAMLAAAHQLIDNPKGMLFIWGPPGNAKTEALIAIVNELEAKGCGPVLYTKLSKIVDHMRDAFSEQKYRDSKGADAQDMGYIARFNRLKSMRILAIDEMDKIKNLTAFVEDFRFDFLDDRYRQAVRGETVTIFASNTDPADLPEPIYDRIREFIIVENTAPSARPNMRRS